MIKPIVLILLFSISLITFSQEHRCAHVLINKYLEKDSAYKKAKYAFENTIQKSIAAQKNMRLSTSSTITIPVVVHVIHNNQPLGINQNISDATILSQIKILNEDYRRKNKDTTLTASEFRSVAADAKIEFCLAKVDTNCNPTSGIVRINYSQRATFGLSNLVELKSLSSWPSDRYLNIWVTDLDPGYLGFAIFPFVENIQGLQDSTSVFTDPKYDGVVIDFKAFGNTGSGLSKIYKLGRTTTHEIGHWLGLIHTFGDEYCGEDYCNDTPRVPSSNGTNACNREMNCDNTGYTMIENFMDYSYDECMNTFTNDQVNRMHAVLQNNIHRKRLLAKNECSSIPEINFVPTTETFENQNFEPYFHFNTKSKVQPLGSNGTNNHSLVLNSISSDTVFTTSILNIDSLNYKYLYFDIATSTNNLNSSSSNFRLEYSVGCSNKWINFKNFTISDVSNSNNPSISDWQTKLIDLKNLNYNYVKFRLIYESNESKSIYIDNINFTESTESKLSFNFDNETRDLQIIPSIVGLKNISYCIYSTEGKIIMQNDINTNNSTIHLKNVILSNQLYMIKATIDNSNYVYKFVCTK